jgi:hypothetical protein
MGYGQTAHNRSVYASPPVGGSGYGFARSFRYAQTFGLNIPTANLRHSLPEWKMVTQRFRRNIGEFYGYWTCSRTRLVISQVLRFFSLKTSFSLAKPHFLAEVV